MSKFSDLIAQTEFQNKLIEKTKIETQQTPKQNAFANLAKTVANRPSAATAREGSGSIDQSSAESSRSGFKFNLDKKKKQSVVSITSPAQPTGAVAIEIEPLQETTAPDFSETKAAEEFQHADQPKEYTDIQVEQLKQALDILKNSIGNKDLVADALKNIMLHLSQHTFLKDILLPEDCQLMTRVLRESYGVTIAKKQTKKAKRETSGKDVDEALDMLSDMDIQI